METKYIPIPIFAERVGVSRQDIYDRAKKDLQRFVKMVDNKKCLSEAALQLFASSESSVKVDTPIDKPLAAEDRLISTLERELERVNCQLRLTTEMLQKTAEMLRDEQSKNTALQEHILKLSNDFSELAKQSNILLSQSQQLQALQAPKPEPQPEPDPPPKKKGLFGRFIKK